MPIFVSGLILIFEPPHSPARRRQPQYPNLCPALHIKTTVAQTQHTGQQKFIIATRSTAKFGGAADWRMFRQLIEADAAEQVGKAGIVAEGVELRGDL